MGTVHLFSTFVVRQTMINLKKKKMTIRILSGNMIYMIYLYLWVIDIFYYLNILFCFHISKSFKLIYVYSSRGYGPNTF